MKTLNIIGNRKERKSKIDFGLADRLNEYYSNPENLKKEQKDNSNETEEEVEDSNSDLSYVEDKELYKEIRNYIKNDYPNLENKLTFRDDVMKGSNPYLAVAVDGYLKKENFGYRIATQADLETDLEKFKRFYVDTGLALRNLTGSNSEQAKYLFNQLKQRGIEEKDFPLWIQLRGLELDSNLNFNLTDESFYKTSECLNWKSGIKFSKVNDFGVPKEKDENSSRQIWTNNNALASCFLGGVSDLCSSGSGLSVSGDYGRMA